MAPHRVHEAGGWGDERPLVARLRSRAPAPKQGSPSGSSSTSEFLCRIRHTLAAGVSPDQARRIHGDGGERGGARADDPERSRSHYD